jgi:hypothetical protein
MEIPQCTSAWYLPVPLAKERSDWMHSSMNLPGIRRAKKESHPVGCQIGDGGRVVSQCYATGRRKSHAGLPLTGRASPWRSLRLSNQARGMYFSTRKVRSPARRSPQICFSHDFAESRSKLVDTLVEPRNISPGTTMQHLRRQTPSTIHLGKAAYPAAYLHLSALKDRNTKHWDKPKDNVYGVDRLQGLSILDRSEHLACAIPAGLPRVWAGEPNRQSLHC